MKGTFFLKPLEVVINLEGEQWSQGDKVQGQLKIKNHGPDEINLNTFQMSYGLGQIKKVNAKDEKAFTLNNEITMPDDSKVSGNGEFKMDFQLELGDNAPITESTSAPYLFFHSKGELFNGGSLILQNQLSKGALTYLDILKTFYKFTPKTFKNKKGTVDIKLIPPSSRELAGVEQLNLIISNNEDSLKLSHQFKVKKLAYGEGNVAAKAVKIKEDIILGNKDLFMFGDSPNQEKLQKVISEVLEKVKSSLL